MIRFLVRFGKWLDSRFPEKLTVSANEYGNLRAEVDLLRDELNELKASHAATIDRVAHLEGSAVHKGAVQELVKHVAEVKTELLSLKASFGFTPGVVKTAEINAILNGEPISNGE